MSWGVPEPSTKRILIHRDYVIGYSDSLLIPMWTDHRPLGASVYFRNRPVAAGQAFHLKGSLAASTAIDAA